MIISDTSRMIGVFTIALLMAEFGQVCPYQNSVYLKYNVFFDEVYCNHTEKVYFKYTISILGVYFNPCGQIAWSIL